MGILGFMLMKFIDIYPNYRELLLQDVLQEMHRLIEFLKYRPLRAGYKGGK